MRIRLDSLAADALDLELSDDPAMPRTAALRQLRQLGGCVHRSTDRIHLRPVEAREVEVASLDWSWPGGHLSLNAPAQLTGLDIDADIGRRRPAGTPLDGLASLASLTGDKITLTLGRVHIRIEHLNLDRVSMHDGREGGDASLGILRATGVEIVIGGLTLAADSIASNRARARWLDGLFIEAGTLQIDGLRVETENLRVEVPMVEAPNGVAFKDGAIEFACVQSQALSIVIHDLLGFRSSAKPADTVDRAPDIVEQAPDTIEQAPPPTRRPLFDMRMLDQLDGNFDIDLTADVSVPVLGSRRATHHFRVPIEHGAIDYKRLENDLSTLEDAIIDFAVRDDQLVLERSVPLLPGLNKPIVVWPLTDVELALAKRKLVRLRTLPSARLASNTKKKSSGGSGKSSVAVRELDFANIEFGVALRPRRPDEQESEPLAGAITSGSIGSVRVQGRVRHIPNRDLDPTVLTIAAEQIQAVLDRMFIGGRATLSIGDGIIGAVTDASLQFHQVTPGRLALRLSAIRLADVSIALGLRKPAT